MVYDKTLQIPKGVAYITFSAQGDTHGLFDPAAGYIPGTGAALLMSASVTYTAGNVTVCSPMATAGGSAEFGAPWMTLLKLPDGETGPNNCNDGGGGPADCHDNAFSFSCCALVTDARGAPGAPGVPGNIHDVKITMASSNGGEVYYEDSTIYIDQGDSGGAKDGFCKGVGTAPH